MNKLLLGFFILTISAAAYGQETKRVKKDEGNVGDLEIFYVLKSNKDIKHGPYEKFLKIANPRNQIRILLERGQFENNKKTGMWSFYQDEETMISQGAYENDLQTGSWEYYKDGVSIEKGNYVNGKREGLWVYFDKENGILERGNYSEGDKIGIWKYHYYNVLVQTYEHSLDSVLQFYDDGSISEAIIDETNEPQEVVLTRPPQYIGHKKQLQRDMAALTKYPQEAKINDLMGEVIVTFIVNEDGTTSDYAVMQDIGGKCGQAVIEAFKENSTKWIPGIYNGKKVKTRIYQTVNFNLEIDAFVGIIRGSIVYE